MEKIKKEINAKEDKIQKRIKELEKELIDHNKKKQQAINFANQETQHIISKAGAIKELQNLIPVNELKENAK